MSVSELPTLTPGLDAPPARCHGCGSALLAPEEPLAGGHFGVLTCSMCGRTLAALGRPLRRAPRRVEPVHPSPPPPRPVPVERGLIEGRFRRVPGCGVSCGVLLGHDPAPHVEYGRALERDALAVRARPTGTVVSGCLRIDLDRGAVTVEGDAVGVSDTEWRILAHLAARLGELCWYEEIVADVWSATTWSVWARRGSSDGRQHGLSVHLSRLRLKLGPAGALIETMQARGLTLLAAPPKGDDRDD